MSKPKPLTLDDLVQYNNQVLLPALDKRFEKIETQLETMVRELREGQEAIQESISQIASVVRKHDDKLEDHDQRIRHLESTSIAS